MPQHNLCLFISILYQRGVYPAESFKRTDKYELTLFMTDDAALNEYLSNVLEQVKGLCNNVNMI